MAKVEGEKKVKGEGQGQQWWVRSISDAARCRVYGLASRGERVIPLLTLTSDLDLNT